MVYDRRIGNRTLNFEASGALLEASLVMRDRETDSWWSIMSSTAIGGELEGEGLDELPVSEKTTWGDWVRRHPDTLVLSVDGREHVAQNPYDNYLASNGTFRNLHVEDRRLRPKASIFSFWLGEQAYASPHRAFEGGRLFTAPELPDRAILLFRAPGSSFYASTRAYLVDASVADAAGSASALLQRIDSGDASGVEPLSGFDTFWYTWVSVQKQTKILQ